MTKSSEHRFNVQCTYNIFMHTLIIMNKKQYTNVVKYNLEKYKNHSIHGLVR